MESWFLVGCPPFISLCFLFLVTVKRSRVNELISSLLDLSYDGQGLSRNHCISKSGWFGDNGIWNCVKINRSDMERGEEMNSHLVCFRLKVFVSLYQTMTFKGTWKYFRGQPTNLAVNVNGCLGLFSSPVTYCRPRCTPTVFCGLGQCFPIWLGLGQNILLS